MSLKDGSLDLIRIVPHVLRSWSHPNLDGNLSALYLTDHLVFPLLVKPDRKLLFFCPVHFTSSSAFVVSPNWN